MKYIILSTIIFCSFQSSSQIRVNPNLLDSIGLTKNVKLNLKWSDTAVNYKIIIKGEIGIGQDDLRSDSRLDVNVIMNNGMVVPLRDNGSGVITNANSSTQRVFHMNLRREQQYVTNLDIAFVEVIHSRVGLPVNVPIRNVDILAYENAQPDFWDFTNIKISGKIIYTNPIDGNEKEIMTKELINKNINQRRSYGVWASGTVIRQFMPPPQITDAMGMVAARVLAGDDGMKKDPENAAVMVQVSSGTLRTNLGRYEGINAYFFPNYDGLIKMEGKVMWRGIGIAGLVYKYGNHGPFERDDWDVKAIMIEFFPDILRSKEICFRKYSHYHSATRANIVRMNGDGNGMEKWAPNF
jgi:hypothetical protein